MDHSAHLWTMPGMFVRVTELGNELEGTGTQVGTPQADQVPPHHGVGVTTFVCGILCFYRFI